MSEVEWASWIGAGVAALSAGWAIKSAREADAHLRETVRLQEQAAQANQAAAKSLERANVILQRGWADQHFAAVREWAGQVVSAIAEAIHLCQYPELAAREETRCGVEARLSSLLDKGRWYFPNHWSDEIGGHKEPAYRGIRQPILERVWDAYDALRSIGAGSSPADAFEVLVRMQRSFVSEVQLVLDPRRRELEVKRVLEEFAEAERLRNAGTEPAR